MKRRVCEIAADVIMAVVVLGGVALLINQYTSATVPFADRLTFGWLIAPALAAFGLAVTADLITPTSADNAPEGASR